MAWVTHGARGACIQFFQKRSLTTIETSKPLYFSQGSPPLLDTQNSAYTSAHLKLQSLGDLSVLSAIGWQIPIPSQHLVSHHPLSFQAACRKKNGLPAFRGAGTCRHADLRPGTPLQGDGGEFLCTPPRAEAVHEGIGSTVVAFELGRGANKSSQKHILSKPCHNKKQRSQTQVTSTSNLTAWGLQLLDTLIFQVVRFCTAHRGGGAVSIRSSKLQALCYRADHGRH